MSLQRNYYEVLGLPPGATTDEIKKKYRELARKFHPDVVQDKVLGQRVFTQINQAYSVLGNPERRAQYNTTLQGGGSQNGTASANAAPKPNGSPPAPQAAPAAEPAKPVSPVRSQANAEMLGRAENATMAGKPVEARTLCVRILEADPRHVRALEILGDALVQMGRREEAAVQYRRALEVVPGKLIQAKLNRLTAAQPSTRTVPPSSPSAPLPPRNGNGNSNGSGVGQKTVLPSSAAAQETEKSSGLLGRLLGRK